MRFRHRDGTTVHLAYCANVHPAGDLAGVLGGLDRIAGPVRERLGWGRLGVGLWLPAPAASGLAADGDDRRRLREGLAGNGLEVVTLNGFPYRGFDEPVVKGAVYRPDWAEPERAGYTLDLAAVLQDLLPDDAAGGSISTLPLAWRTPWDDQRAGAAVAALGSVGEILASRAEASGRPIRLGLEPEPGCVLETTAQAAAVLGGLVPGWVGVCLDACHLAVAFERPEAALEGLAEAGVAVVKAQVSSALRAAEPGRARRVRRLEAFVEPRFLHQTREGTRSAVVGTDDLDAALAGGLPGVGEWRVHFHVPVHTTEGTTADVTEAVLAGLVGGEHPLTPHLEVETYTWSVLPGDRRPAGDAGLVEGLAAELAWTRDRLVALGLEELG